MVLAERKRLNLQRVLASLTIGILVLGSFLALETHPVYATSLGKYFDNVVVIVMENEGVCNIMGSVLGCSPNLAPYETSLAQNYALATHYTAVTHPSMPNYLALFSGQTWGCTSDDNPDSSTCTQNAWTSSNSNLVDRLPSSITWKAYMENMTSNCQTTSSSTYLVRHDPFVYFNDIVGNSTRCAQVVPAGSGGSLDSTLLNDLNSASAPNLMWLTPNLCDDMHDVCTGSSNQTTTNFPCYGTNTTICVPMGDNYLKHLVPNIISSYTFTHGRAALFITYDEGNGYCTNGNSNDDCVYAVWAGRVTKTLFSSATAYKPGHYSWLATIDDNWQISCLSNDCTPTPIMSEFFIPNYTMSTNPMYVSIFCNIYGCDPARTLASNLTLNSFNQFQGIVNLTYISPPNGVSSAYLTGPSSANVPVQGLVVGTTAHGGGTVSGTFVWTVNGKENGGSFSMNTTLTIHYTWCAHCTIPP